MLIEVLVKDQIEDGRKLIEKLQQNGFPISAAFWEREPDREYWQLILAAPWVEDPKNAYEQVRALWDSFDLHSIQFTDVVLLNPKQTNYIRYHMYLPYRRGSNPTNLKLENGYIYFISPEATPNRWSPSAS